MAATMGSRRWGQVYHHCLKPTLKVRSEDSEPGFAVDPELAEFEYLPLPNPDGSCSDASLRPVSGVGYISVAN